MISCFDSFRTLVAGFCWANELAVWIEGEGRTITLNTPDFTRFCAPASMSSHLLMLERPG